MITFDQLHVGVEIVLTVIIPVFAWSARNMREKVEAIADAKTQIIKTALTAHEQKDETRFTAQETQTRQITALLEETKRTQHNQHVENSSKLADIAGSVRPLSQFYEAWIRAKVGGGSAEGSRLQKEE